MKVAKPILALVVLAVASIVVYSAFGPKKVAWEIVREDWRQKYVEVLTKQGVPYNEETDHLGRRWIVVEGYTPSALEEKTKEFDAWVQEQRNAEQGRKPGG